MKERIVQLLDLEQLSPSKFADIIGVQRSSVSHVVSGRNKPSFDFLQKTLRAFPGLNAEWLMLGEGTMYEQMGRGVSGNLFTPPAESPEAPFPADIPTQEPIAVGKEDSGQQFAKEFSVPKNESDATATPPETDNSEEFPEEGPSKSVTLRKVVQVMVFYDDDTFRSYGPSQ